MYVRKTKGPGSVMLPDGTIMTRADLPSPATRRWVASRKAAVVRAVQSGLLTGEEAREMYALSEEELASWINTMSAHGQRALRVTRLQKYR
ncbi:MAG: CtrA inhibitor SciP [Brevirhabdus sp.]